jgi:hypothetical protein
VENELLFLLLQGGYLNTVSYGVYSHTGEARIPPSRARIVRVARRCLSVARRPRRSRGVPDRLNGLSGRNRGRASMAAGAH